ncbi:MAG: hypothetical protein KCHDKBKB_01521 [Elusimicrobia bacterium]|nr:hypothetical protein [Elusimicrobiota bacterium]
MENGHEAGKEKLKTLIEEQATKIKEKMAEVEWNEVPEEIKTYVRKKPWKSLAIALGMGLLAGYVLKSNKKDQ